MSDSSDWTVSALLSLLSSRIDNAAYTSPSCSNSARVSPPTLETPLAAAPPELAPTHSSENCLGLRLLPRHPLDQSDVLCAQ